jgi:hypothetical protein
MSDSERKRDAILIAIGRLMAVRKIIKPTGAIKELELEEHLKTALAEVDIVLKKLGKEVW